MFLRVALGTHGAPENIWRINKIILCGRYKQSWTLSYVLQFLNHAWAGDKAATRPLPTKDNTNTEKTHTSMPRVGFEATTLVLELTKTVHGLDSVASVTASFLNVKKK
jgi:hypothetical protein